MNNTMNHTINITADELEDRLIGLLDEVTVRNDYSGRGMYGDVCFGIVTSQSDVLVGYALGRVLEELEGDGFEVLAKARTDNMGYDAIIYFPGFRLAE